MRIVATRFSQRRKKALDAALKDSATLRTFLRDNAREESELLYMLERERRRSITAKLLGEPAAPVRRSVLKRLHGAYCTARNANEWAELAEELRTGTIR